MMAEQYTEQEERENLSGADLKNFGEINGN